MNLYTVKLRNDDGILESTDVTGDTVEIFTNGTLLIKRGGDIVFAAVQQEWARLESEIEDDKPRKR